MHLSTLFDPQASATSDRPTFFCDRFSLTREDIADFKERKLLKFVNPDDLPESIPCQVLVQCENARNARITFFNPAFRLPEAVYDDPFLNKDLIEGSKASGGFQLVVTIPLNESGIEFGFSYSN